jgi:hypothetical protein
MKFSHFIIVSLVFSAFFAVSCNKDKFTTKPQLKLKSINTDTVFVNTLFQMDISFTDQEGDIDSVTIRKVFTNKNRVPTNDRRKVNEEVPPVTRSGNIIISYYHGSDPGQQFPAIGDPIGIGDDLVIYKIVAKDAAGNISDTLETSVIRIKSR